MARASLGPLSASPLLPDGVGGVGLPGGSPWPSQARLGGDRGSGATVSALCRACRDAPRPPCPEAGARVSVGLPLPLPSTCLPERLSPRTRPGPLTAPRSTALLPPFSTLSPLCPLVSPWVPGCGVRQARNTHVLDERACHRLS